MARELVVGCYTPGAYAEVANTHILPSLRRLGLQHVVREIPDRGSWILNNAACQLYLRELEREFPSHDMLYCDVDAVVHSDPWPYLRDLDACDVGAYWLHWPGRTDGMEYELLSGTLWLPAGPTRAELLDVWIERNRRVPGRWDQRNLQDILTEPDSPFVHVQMGPEMCCIHDIQRVPSRTPDIVPVVEHFQASRRHARRQGGRE